MYRRSIPVVLLLHACLCFATAFLGNCYPTYVSMKGYIGYCFFSLSDYRYLDDGSTDRRESLRDGTYRSRTGFSDFGGGAPGDPPNPKFWA